MSTEATDTSPRKVRRQQAAEALNAIAALVQGPRGAKKAAKTAAKLQRKDSRKAAILQILTSGNTGKEGEPLKVRTALARTAVVIKCGATSEELQRCTALQAVTDWSKLVEPLVVFAQAKQVDPSILLAGFNIEKDRQPSQAADLTVPCLASDDEPNLAKPGVAVPGRAVAGHACDASEANPGMPVGASPAKEPPKPPTEAKPSPKAPHGRHIKGRS